MLFVSALGQALLRSSFRYFFGTCSQAFHQPKCHGCLTRAAIKSIHKQERSFSAITVLGTSHKPYLAVQRVAHLIIQGCYQSVQVTASVSSAADDDGVDTWMHPAHLAALLWTLLPPVPVAQQAVMVVVVDLDCTLAGDALRVHRQLEVVAPANIVKADAGRPHPFASCGR